MGVVCPKTLFTYRNEYYVYKDTNSESNTINQGGAIQQLRHAKFAILDPTTPLRHGGPLLKYRPTKPRITKNYKTHPPPSVT